MSYGVDWVCPCGWANLDVRAKCRNCGAEKGALSVAESDVISERRRQRLEEGWTPEHDDHHARGDMAAAAACYALNSATASRFVADVRIPANEIDASASRCPAPPGWPWSAEWWKPKGRRRDLVRAAALLVAEIERLDRAEEKAKAEGAANG